MKHLRRIYWFLQYVFQVIYDDGEGVKVRADVKTAWLMADIAVVPGD